MNEIVYFITGGKARIQLPGGESVELEIPDGHAMKHEERAGGRIHVVHVLKTIDNDLDLPAHVDT